MFNKKFRPVIYNIMTLVFVLIFFQTANATMMDSIGTGSSGAYSHEDQGSEGSKSQVPMKSEGSGSKAYSKPHGYTHQPHSYSHKKEGSGLKSYAHKRSHGFSKHSHGSHSKCPFSHLLRFRDQLELTEAQVAEIQEMRFQYSKHKVNFEAQKKMAKMELNHLVHSATMDENAIRAAGEKIVEVKGQMIRAKVEAKIALLKLLTPDQRKKAGQLHSAH